MAFTPSKVIRCYGTGAPSNASTKTDTTNKYVQHGRFRAAGASKPTNYVSLAVFDDFSEDFTKNSITEISISFTAAGGYHGDQDGATKTLEFYFGYTETTFKNLYNQTDAAEGVIEHTFKQNPNKATFNITITNSNILSSFETAFSKGIKTITFYCATDYSSGKMSSNTTAHQGWSSNYVQISNLTLEVQTQPRGATIKSLSSSVELEENCSITIEPLSGSYTYRAYCQLGSKKTILYTPTNNVFSIPIPKDWGSEIPTSMTGTGTAIVETLSGTQVIGTTLKNFNITVPDYPDEDPFGALDCDFITCYNSSNTELFLIGYSTANISGTLQEYYGATLKEITLSYGPISKQYSKQISDKILMPNSTTPPKITVKDSRNFQYTYSFTPPSHSYATGVAPTLTNFSVARCDTNGDYSSSGTFVRVTGTLSSPNSNIQIQVIDKDKNPILTNFTTKESGSWYSKEYTFLSDKDYSLILRAASTKYYLDSDSTNPIFTGYSVTLPSSSFLLHFSNTGTAIGIGCAAEGTTQITAGWQMKLKQGFSLPRVNADNTVTYIPFTDASQLGGSGSVTIPEDLVLSSLKIGEISFLTGANTSPDLSTTYFLPVQIVDKVPDTNIAKNVIYFVKSST